MYQAKLQDQPSIHLFRLVAVALMLLPMTAILAQTHPATSAPELLQSYRAADFGPLPFAFVGNQGQADASVRFQTQGLGGSIAFTQQGLELNRPGASADQGTGAELQLRFVGANPDPALVSGPQLPGIVNVIQGRDPAGWYTNLPTYGQIEYRALYPGISLRYEGVDGRLKGTYTVAPGADPSRIRWRYAGAAATGIDPASGDLQVAMGGADRVVEQAPVAWQQFGDQRIPVAVSYALAGDGSLGFSLGTYDRTLPLVIDPTIHYETTVPGPGLEHGLDVTVDADGNAYIIAYSYVDDHAVLAIKLDANGDLAWTTYLDGSAIDYGAGIAADNAGGVYLTGFTDSEDFPILNPLQGTLVGFRDAFLTRLSVDDGSLLYSTFLGGNYTDMAGEIALNDAGEIYLVGSTWSDDFPLVDPFQDQHQGPPYASADFFITRISADGQTILYSTYLGGYDDDMGDGIALDGYGRIYVSGTSNSDDFPLESPFQAVNLGSDMVLARLTADGSALEYSTYLGGTNSDHIGNLAVDGTGSAYISGSTLSEDFPTTPGAYQEEFVGGILACEIPFSGDRNCYDMFVTKFTPDGTALAYSTYIGGYYDDEARSIAIDSDGGAHLVGYTFSDDFPMSGGCSGCVLSPKLSADGSTLEYTFARFSGSSNAGGGITVDGADATYLTGAINVPADVYVVKLTDGPPPYPTMHVDGIFLKGRYVGSRPAIWAVVRVVDTNGDPVPDADVTIGVTTALDPYRLFTRTTRPQGYAIKLVGSVIGGYWEVCVTDLSKVGVTYEPWKNVETCDTINFP